MDQLVKTIMVFGSLVVAFASGFFAANAETKESDVQHVNAYQLHVTELYVYMYDDVKHVWERATEYAIAKLACPNVRVVTNIRPKHSILHKGGENGR